MKTLKLFFILFLLVFTVQVYAQTVYITNTGEKYHTYSCRYLKHSKKEIAFEDAVSRGYESCLVCKPSSKTTGSNNATSPYNEKPLPNTSSKKATATQCTGRTKSGTRCKRRTKNTNGRCYQH